MKYLTSSTAALIASACLAASASATPGSGFVPGGIVNGHFGTLNENTASEKTGSWGYHLKTLDDTDLGVDRLSIAPGGYSGWHAHPGPVYVTVTQGSVIWYDGADPLCPAHTYTTGQSFIEQPYKAHNAKNASGSSPAEYIAMTIKPEGFVGPAFRLDRPQPNNCSF